MIGKKTLPEIKASLRTAFGDAKIDPAEAIAGLLQKLDLKSSPSTEEVETLELIRSGLQAQSTSRKRPRREARTM